MPGRDIGSERRDALVAERPTSNVYVSGLMAPMARGLYHTLVAFPFIPTVIKR